jgi:hypothetical protein
MSYLDAINFLSFVDFSVHEYEHNDFGYIDIKSNKNINFQQLVDTDNSLKPFEDKSFVSLF